MAFRKILCPIDFSAGSRRATAAAVRLALEHRSELVLFHAWGLPPISFVGDYVYPADLVQDFSDDAQRGLDAAVADARALGAPQVTGKLVRGPAWQAIVEASATDPAIDLIVIGTHGRTGLSRVVMGSIAEAVVRHAACPVLTIRAEGELRPFRHILCPVDFSPEARAAVDLAAGLVQPGGTIALLHVVELAVAWGELRPFDVDRHLSALAKAELVRWAQELAPRVTGSVSNQIVVGRPGAELLAFIERDPTIDLVVMGNRGRTGVARLALGSVAEKLVRHAGCPVLIAHARG